MARQSFSACLKLIREAGAEGGEPPDTKAVMEALERVQARAERLEAEGTANSANSHAMALDQLQGEESAAASLELDAGALDHFGPFGRIRRDQSGEFLGRAAGGLVADAGEVFLEGR